MSCAQVREVLPEIAGGELTGAAAEAARAHTGDCPECARRLEELEATIALSHKVGIAPLPSGFREELHRRLVEAGPPPLGWLMRVRQAIATRPLTATLSAAGVAALLGIAVAERLQPPKIVTVAAAPAPIASVPQSKVALVKIDFVAERAVDEVQFEIMLPDGLRFYSGGHELAERSFRWSGRLDSGSNPLPIAVKGSRPGRYHVVAHAVGDGLDVTHDVLLEVVS